MANQIQNSSSPAKADLPVIKQRPRDELVYRAALKLRSEPVARVLAGRVSGLNDEALEVFLSPSLAVIQPPELLPDMRKAAERIADAVMDGSTQNYCVDFDSDGSSAGAIFLSAMTQRFGVAPERIRFYIAHRLLEGYGLNAKVTDRILADPDHGSLVITADCGSTDEKQIARLAAAGVSVVISDHHNYPESNLPRSAYAFVSPKAPGNRYDPNIAGCMVAWLLMSAVRRVLIDRKYLPADAPKLLTELSYAMVGTQSDAVSLTHSLINRAVIRAGLKILDKGELPAWRVIKDKLLMDNKPATSDFVAFYLAPMIAAAGRLDESMPGIRFLTASTIEDAEAYYKEIEAANVERRAVEKALTIRAINEAQKQVEAGRHGLAVYLSDGHAGVGGICASRLKETFGRPAVMISPRPSDPEEAAMSFRSIDGLNIYEMLAEIRDENPGLFQFGGHAFAAGGSIRVPNIDFFSNCFNRAAMKRLAGKEVHPIILSDGELPPAAITLALADHLEQLDPYGKDFDTPIFESEFLLRSIDSMGAKQEHRMLMVEVEPNRVIRAAFFNRDFDRCGKPALFAKRHVRLAYSVVANNWNGQRRVQLVVRHAVMLETLA